MDGSTRWCAPSGRSRPDRPASSTRRRPGHGRPLPSRTCFGSRSGQVAISAVALGWIAPNDAFEPTAPDAPDATLRLAWVVEARTQGDLSDGLRAVKLFLDAGSGALLGGDVLR